MKKLLIVLIGLTVISAGATCFKAPAKAPAAPAVHGPF